MDVARFVNKWRESSSSELGNKDSFLVDLCDVLGVPRPKPATGVPSTDSYVFEKRIPVTQEGGKVVTMRADLYKQDCFLLEAKQTHDGADHRKNVKAKRGSNAWEVLMAEAFGQALRYARSLDEPPPFLVICDIGYVFELYANFDGSGKWCAFPDAKHRRIYVRDLNKHLDTLRAVFLDPYSLDPARSAGASLRKDAPLIAEQMGVNPFEHSQMVPPERFVGRTAQRADVKARIGAVSAQSISIVGHRRSGKSSLLRYIEGNIDEFCPPDQNPLVVRLDLQLQTVHKPEGILERLRRAIERHTGKSPWRADQNGDGFAVEDGLAELRDKDVRLIVLLDELERISDRLERFQDWGEDFRAKATAGYFALGITSRRPLSQVYSSCGLTSPFGNIFTTLMLGAMPHGEWVSLVRRGFECAHREPTEADLNLIDELAGGMPYYVQLASSLLWQHRCHDVVIREFRFQTRDRFTELWKDLSEAEHCALRRESGLLAERVTQREVMQDLVRLGMIRETGGLFSAAFAEFVREQR